MGVAEHWQAQLESELAGTPGTILNPRRDDWDSSWVQSKDSPQFREQVEWELLAQERADIIAMYFDPATKSPITLMELGLFVQTRSAAYQKLVVCCPAGFWRKGNVDIVCDRYHVPQVASKASLVDFVKVRARLTCAKV